MMDTNNDGKSALTPRQLANMHHLRRTGYLPTVEQLAKRLSAPFWWTNPITGRIEGGSICFVHTGSTLLGVTAAHVHDCYFSRRADRADLHCQIGSHTFDPMARLIDIDRSLDVATYQLSEIQVNAARADIHYAPTWPPEIDRTDVHLVCGWISALAKDRGSSVTHSFLHFIAGLSSASEASLGIVTYTSTSTAWGGSRLPAGTNMGGMSGGPLYRMSETGLSSLTLVGVVYEYQPSFEIVVGRPLSTVKADGSIRPLP